MQINTKYDLGQKVFFVELSDGKVSVIYKPIDRINLGGKAWELYELGSYNRSERDLFLDFESAKEAAIEKQKEWNIQALEKAMELKPPQDAIRE